MGYSLGMNVQTTVFRRIVLEQKIASYKAGYTDGYTNSKDIGIQGMTEMMAESYRFSSFSKEYIKSCAERLWLFFSRNSKVINTNQRIDE